ncbi:MAG: vWA domain-containing protein, partial [Verrucomicrobiota bacterium]
MNLQFTHPAWLLLLPPALGWTLWLAWRSDASLDPWRRWASTALRVGVVLLLVLGLAGLQFRRPQEGMNVFFLLDRSDSVPSPLQEESRAVANRLALGKRKDDRAGFLIFGADAALETEARETAQAEKIQAVVDGQRTDIAGAVRL